MKLPIFLILFGSNKILSIAVSITVILSSDDNAPESIILGAFGPALVGTVGMHRERHTKKSHKVHLWGMYVAPDHRRQGVGSELLRAALDHARRLPDVRWVQLSVSSAAPAAQRLYERTGFQIWGTEPDALRHDGRAAVEHHMALRLASFV